MHDHKKEKIAKIPTRNYIYLFIILLSSVLLLFYIYTWYETYQENKLYISTMNNYLTVINYNELDDYITENKDAILYVSILGNKSINRFEEKFKNNIIDNNLRNNILYLDVTNENENNVKKKLTIDSELPYLVVYTNGRITDTYSIGSTNYNLNKTMKYLNRIGAGDND